MAAIPTIYTGGNGLAGFTAVEGAFSEDINGIVPTNPAINNTLIFDTAYTQTTNPDQGFNGKATFLGGCERGSEIWLIYQYVDVNNFRYLKIRFGGIQIFSDLFDDEFSLWAVESGATRQVQGDSPLEYLQENGGDLRHWVLESGSAASITTVDDQHITKYSGRDSIENDTDYQDIILLRETDTPTATSGKFGISFRAGSHTNGVSKLQAGLIRAYRSAPSGNDTNAGTVAAPFRTINKLYNTVLAGQIGIIDGAGGTFDESNINFNGGNDWKNGTMWEDACTFLGKAGTTITQNCGGGGSGYYVGGDSSFTKARYRVLCGPWIQQGTAGSKAENGTRFSGSHLGGSGTTSKYVRMQAIRPANCNRPHRVFDQVFYTGTAPWNVAPVAEDFQMFFQYLDCSGDGSTLSHGWYCDMSNIRYEYCKSQYNTGNPSDSASGYGFQLRHGTVNGPYGLGLYATNNQRLHFCVARDNKNAGYVYGKGTNNKAFGCLSYEAGVTSTGGGGASGFVVDTETTNTYYLCCIAYNNAKYGFEMITFYNGTPDIENTYYINCTAYGNSRNYAINAFSGSLIDNVVFMNCSAYAPVTANYSPNLGPGTVNATRTTNHETADSGFGGTGGIFGDPLFTNPANGDFHLQAGSPLIGAGSDASAYFTKDFERKPLPQGSWHIGAYAPVSPSTELSAIRRHRSRIFPQMNVFA